MLLSGVDYLDRFKGVQLKLLAWESLLTNYPKCSQDLNPIETAWRELRARLADTEPARIESRAAFIQRLRAAVAWINRNRHDYLLEICTAQKAWAKDVQKATPPGGRTSH